MQETADHLLYPNPASQMVSDEHLQYFEFFGKILGKVCFLCWSLCLVHLDEKFIIKLSGLTTLKIIIVGFDRVDID